MDPNPECMDPYHYGNLYLHPQLHQLKIRIHPHQGSKLDPEPDGVGEYSPTQWFTPMTDRGWGKYTVLQRNDTFKFHINFDRHNARLKFTYCLCFESTHLIFRYHLPLKYLNSLMRIRDGKN
jgi:hypothetical protein